MRRYLWPVLWLGALIAYVLGGTALVPFHGDESTTLWMSRDYGYIMLDGKLDAIRYQEPPPNATEQHMRLITGSLTKYLMGVSWQMNGYTTETINEQWDWGADWNYNQQFGHAPDDTLLMLGRWPSALMLAASVIVLFSLGWLLGGRPVAYLASLYYVLNPAILLNGRRAMFEGGLLFFSLLTVLVAIWFLQRRDWRAAVALGFAAGFAVAAKHPAVFTVGAVFVAALISLPRQKYSQLLAAGLLAFGVFYVIHPVWWGNPFERVRQVYEARSGILEGQVAAFGDYDGIDDQISGFLRQVFVVQPQYYEVDSWEAYIGDQITRYENTIWRGVPVGGSVIGAVFVGLCVLIGLGVLAAKRQHHTASWVVMIWSVVILATSGVLTPLEWQRYFLMTYPVVGLLAALGLVWMTGQVYHRIRPAAAPVIARNGLQVDSAQYQQRI